MNTHLPSREIRIRLAGPSDIHRVAAILREGLNQPINTRYLIAERAASAEMLGSAYFRIAPGPQGERLAALRIAAQPGTLTSETATALLKAGLTAAKNAGAWGVAYDGMVPAGSQEEARLCQAGFKPIQTLIDYEIDCRAAQADLDRTMEHMKKRGKVPAESAVIALDDAPITAVNTLLAHNLGGSFATLAAPVLADISTVVKLGPRIVGVTAAVVKGTAIDVPYTATEPEFRNGWVTPAMWQRIVMKALAAGCNHLTYCTNGEQFRKMSNFTRRLGAKETNRHLRYGRGLQA